MYHSLVPRALRGFALVCGAAFVLAACDTAGPTIDGPTSVDPVSDGPLGGITAAPSFDFATSQPIGLTLTEADTDVPTRYDVWRVGTDGERYYLGAALADASGQTTLPFAVPTATERLIVKRNASGDVSETEVTVAGGQASHAFAGKASGGAKQCTESLVAVNGNRDHFLVDYEAFSETTLPTLPYGTAGMAVDPIGQMMYFTVKDSNDAQKLYSYDLSTQVFAVVGDSPKSNAIAFEPRSGTLYTLHNRVLRSISVSTGAEVQQWSVPGVDNTNSGDLMITVDGSIYYAAKKKMWRIDDNDATSKTAVLLIDTFPKSINGGTVDGEGQIYLNAGTTLYRVDRLSGQFQQVHEMSIGVNDLDFLPCATGPSYNQDQDNDGVPDVFDDFPTEANFAFERYSPSEYVFGAVAFEDLWPGTGDYDFNDLVVRYRYREITNSASEVVRFEADYAVQAVGAGFVNGFGVELPVAASNVESVTYSRQPGTVTLAANGVEAGHTNAVVIPFDDAKAMIPGAVGFVNTEAGSPVLASDTVNVLLQFTTPLQGSLLMDAPYNPFLFRKNDRGVEVHLPDAAPTALADDTVFGTFHDRTNVGTGTTYRTEAGLPWALHLPEGFVHPIEQRDLTQGYPRFVDWVQSNGASFPDWYGASQRTPSHLFGIE
ncbi:MAG: LruC domain-containing protein [Bacteroidota bacterium]